MMRVRAGPLAWAVLAVLILWGWVRWIDDERLLNPAPSEHIPAGESLLYGIEVPALGGRLSWAMPVSSVSEALSSRHRRAVTLAALTACMILLFGLGRLLRSDACGLLAVWMTVCFDLITPGAGLEHYLYVLAVLLVANLVAWRARRPGLGTSGWLGAGIGASLLVRSPLFLFPAVLAVYERFRPRARWRLWVAPCLLPVLFLLPWIHMNWKLERKLVPFEGDRPAYNIIEGAMGLAVTGPSVDHAGLARAAGPDAYSRPIRWAAREAARHPVRCLAGVGRRLWFAFTLQPLLCAAAALSLWLFRRCEAHLETGLLAGYFIGVHCLMAVMPRYFTPAWPVLAALAASLCTSWLHRGKREAEGPPPCAHIHALMWPLLLWSVFVLGLVSAYPYRRDRPTAAVGR